jgi:hypothetical protein
MLLTKEKILAAITLVVSAFTLLSASVPAVEPVPSVPQEEVARPYRAVSAAPRLSPEGAEEGERNPFSTKDPWQVATPALLVVPPAQSWPRALLGGPDRLPASPGDRLLVRRDPKVGGK